MKTLKASEEFVTGKNNISYVSPIFKEHFYGIEFKREGTKLESRTLPRAMNSKEIIEEWNPAPVTLGNILDFLETANHSEWYLFHTEDVYGVLWAVRGHWFDDGWYFFAYPLGYPRYWDGGAQFLSRAFNEGKITSASGEEIKVSDSDKDWVRSQKWHLNYGGYALNQDGKLMARLLIERMTGEVIPEGMQVDHKDRDRLNNTRENLRLATPSQNTVNSTSVGNKTGFRGVRKPNKGKKWEAVITLNQEKIFLGGFDSPEEAAVAYNEKANELFGEFAVLNIFKI